MFVKDENRVYGNVDEFGELLKAHVSVNVFSEESIKLRVRLIILFCLQ